MLINDTGLGYPKTDSLFLFQSVDGGSNWQSKSIYFGDYAYPTAISAPNSNTLFIGGSTNLFANAKMLKSTNNGQSWNEVTLPSNLNDNYINILNFYDSNFGIITGDTYVDEFLVFHTSDGGNTWNALADNLIPDALLSEFSTAGQTMGDYLWFTTNYGRIYKSADRGYHWEVYQSPLNNLEGISFSDTLNGIALYGFIVLDFNTSPIIITADGGKTWKKLDITPLGPKTGIFGASYIPNSSYIMLTTAKNSLLTGDFATWISPDRGETWQQISSGENIYTINFLDASTGWGGEGQQLAHPTRMFQYTGSPLVGLFSDKVLQVEWDVFPNPTADRVQVRVQEEKPASYLLLVNDLQGKLILRQEWDGTGMLDLDLGACANGLYTLTLASKDGKAVRKLVVSQ
ncbi:MAG: YCF48-related protein [Saprospiraceae bacterium]|nr:YCF48-related protein [Saprospiraceae bacterium]